MKKMKTRTLVFLALMAAVATILMYFEMPLPFMPPFLKLDLSSLPVVLTSFIMGPVQSLFVVLVKDLVHLISTQTGGVGELADFIMTAAFSLTAGGLYHGMKKTHRGVVMGCVTGILAITVAALAANYFLLIPFYSKIMPIEAIVAACNALNSNINDISGYYWFGVLPFNLIKGTVVCLVTVFTYKRLAKAVKMDDYL
ncbi:MAG: ECF transporter S component [Oscillospiraceae bacterium]|nr:ECF transporter S component [Oscillospiraceae bacterium]